MEFIRKLFGKNKKTAESQQDFRGAAPLQSQEEQDAVRERMETEMAEERDRREARKANE